MCTDCSSEPSAPAHIIKYLGVPKQDLADDLLLVLDYLRVYDVMCTWPCTAGQWGRVITTPGSKPLSPSSIAFV
ncbi:hypothetical protein TNCV_988411 [Trichonephila clavipes]|nr:hypothetical protein TNCV_988411 [Trichonephila clavipes]